MEPKVLARAGAVIFVALMIAAAWIELSRTTAHPQQPDATSQPASETSLRENLLRCAELGEAALRDDDCQKAWAESRNRFLHGQPAELPTPRTNTEPLVSGVSQLSSEPASARAPAVNNVGVIDHFLDVFTRYIDSGFGLLGGEVGFVATTLIAIDVTLAALFWSWGADDDIIARLVKKTLFVGVFAYLIGNWNNLARIVFESFAGLGLKASGTGFTTANLLRPGKVAETGLDAGRPLLDAISGLMGYWSFFENFIQIVCLFFAWALVLLAFFILAIQLFVTLIEFKLATLAGFVLIPFGLFGKTAFMAERVLGHVVSSGIKVLVLAVIIGIGSTLFSEFTAGFGTLSPTIDDAMAIVLAALSLLGLGIFGPAIANGLVSGGPQLGAGAAVGTGVAAAGLVASAAAATSLGARAIGQGSAAAARGASTISGAASTGYTLGSLGRTGPAAVAAGVDGAVRGTFGAASSALRRVTSRSTEALRSSSVSGSQAAFDGTGGSSSRGSLSGNSQSASAEAPGSPPAWAQRLRHSQTIAHGVSAAAHSVRAAESHGAGSTISLSERS